MATSCTISMFASSLGLRLSLPVDLDTFLTTMFMSSTYLRYNSTFIPLASSLLINSLSHHTINICATSPVRPRPIGPPSLCRLTSPSNLYIWFPMVNFTATLRASASIFFVASLSGTCSGSFHGLYLFVVSSSCAQPVMLGGLPLLCFLLGQY